MIWSVRQSVLRSAFPSKGARRSGRKRPSQSRAFLIRREKPEAFFPRARWAPLSKCPESSRGILSSLLLKKIFVASLRATKITYLYTIGHFLNSVPKRFILHSLDSVPSWFSVRRHLPKRLTHFGQQAHSHQRPRKWFLRLSRISPSFFQSI